MLLKPIFLLPEELIIEIGTFLSAKDLTSYHLINKLVYNRINNPNKDIFYKAIQSQWGNKLLLFYTLLGCEYRDGQDLKDVIKNIFSKRLSRPYDFRFITLKPFATSYRFLNILFDKEDLMLWTPTFLTSDFERNDKNWIGTLKLGTVKNDRVYYISKEHETVARTIQHMDMQMRTIITRCTDVRIVGQTSRGTDHWSYGPVSMQNINKLKMYCQWCDYVQKASAFKKRKVIGKKHIPTEYINSQNKTKTYSFHAMQCMDLHRGSRCSVRIKFKIYPNPAHSWQWFMRVVFDKIRIYV